MNIVLGNYSLDYVPVSFMQTIKVCVRDSVCVCFFFVKLSTKFSMLSMRRAGMRNTVVCAFVYILSSSVIWLQELRETNLFVCL